MGLFMERKSKLREAIETVKKDVQGVKQDIQGITGEARETVAEFKETAREAVPRPLKRRIQKRVDNLLSGRRRKVR